MHRATKRFRSSQTKSHRPEGTSYRGPSVTAAHTLQGELRQLHQDGRSQPKGYVHGKNGDGDVVNPQENGGTVDHDQGNPLDSAEDNPTSNTVHTRREEPFNPVPSTWETSMSLVKRIQQWNTPSALLAVLLTRGSTSFSKREYARMSRILNKITAETDRDKFPSYEHLRRGLFPFLMKHIPSETPDEVGIVPPSLWAVLDVKDPVFMTHVNEENNTFHSFYNVLYNTERFDSLDNERVFDCPDNIMSRRFRRGDKVQVTLDETPSHSGYVLDKKGKFTCEIGNISPSKKVILPNHDAPISLDYVQLGDLVAQVKPLHDYRSTYRFYLLIFTRGADNFHVHRKYSYVNFQ